MRKNIRLFNKFRKHRSTAWSQKKTARQICVCLAVSL